MAKSAATVRARRAVAGGLVVAGLALLSIAVRYALALEQTAPWIMGDELRYSDMAKGFLEHGRLLVREGETPFATAYPALISPAWSAGDIATSYEIAKAINVVLMTLSALIVFLWLRRVVARRYALVAAGLVLLMPTFVYTGTLMTENAALPAFLLGAYVMSRTLERPSLLWQLGLFAAIGLAAAMRVQVITLMIVYPSAILLFAFFERRAGTTPGVLASLRRFAPSFAILGGGAIAYVAYKATTGGSLSSGLGAYATVGQVDYDAGQVVRWTVWHAGELAFSVGFIPAVALGVLSALALARGSLPNVGERAFVAVTVATTFWFVLQAAVFASRFTGRIEERYMVYAAPLLLMALVVWLARAVPRPLIATVSAAVVVMALVMLIPFERFFNVAIFADSFGLIPVLRLHAKLGGDITDVRLAVAAGGVVAAIACIALTTQLARVVFPAAVAIFLLLSGYTVYGAIEVQSTAARAASGVADPSWVDRAIGPEPKVGFIYSASFNANPHLLWQTEFWNRSVSGVYALGTDNFLTFGGPELKLGASGRLLPKPGEESTFIDEPYVLADPNLGIVGQVVARPGPLALIRASRPIRISRAAEGIYADGWSGPLAALSQYSPLPHGARRVRVTVSRQAWVGPDVPGHVTVATGPLRMTENGPALARTTAKREWTVHSQRARAFILPVPPAPFRLEVRVTPTFTPSQFGSGDTRQLGAQVVFEPIGRAGE